MHEGDCVSPCMREELRGSLGGPSGTSRLDAKNINANFKSKRHR